MCVRMVAVADAPCIAALEPCTCHAAIAALVVQIVVNRPGHRLIHMCGPVQSSLSCRPDDVMEFEVSTPVSQPACTDVATAHS